MFKIRAPAGCKDQVPGLQGCDQTLVCLGSVGSAAQGPQRMRPDAASGVSSETGWMELDGVHGRESLDIFLQPQDSHLVEHSMTVCSGPLGCT